MKTILVPTDFSEFGNNGILLAAGLAEKTGAQLILQHNVPMPSQWVHAGQDNNDHRDSPTRMEESELNFQNLFIKNRLS